MAKAKSNSKPNVPKKPVDTKRLVVKVYVNEREQKQIRVAAAMANQAVTEFCRATLVEQAKLSMKKIAELESD